MLCRAVTGKAPDRSGQDRDHHDYADPTRTNVQRWPRKRQQPSQESAEDEQEGPGKRRRQEQTQEQEDAHHNRQHELRQFAEEVQRADAALFKFDTGWALRLARNPLRTWPKRACCVGLARR